MTAAEPLLIHWVGVWFRGANFNVQKETRLEELKLRRKRSRRNLRGVFLYLDKDESSMRN